MSVLSKPPCPPSSILISPLFSGVLLYPTAEVLGIIPLEEGLSGTLLSGGQNSRQWILRWRELDKALSLDSLQRINALQLHPDLSANISCVRSDPIAHSLPPCSRPARFIREDLNSADLSAFLLSSPRKQTRTFIFQRLNSQCTCDVLFLAVRRLLCIHSYLKLFSPARVMPRTLFKAGGRRMSSLTESQRTHYAVFGYPGLLMARSQCQNIPANAESAFSSAAESVGRRAPYYHLIYRRKTREQDRFYFPSGGFIASGRLGCICSRPREYPRP